MDFKNKYFLLLAIVALCFSSCYEDDVTGQGSPAKFGDEITFGGALNVTKAGKDTRTVYGDRADDANGVNTTEIKWVDGDMVRIYCAEAIPAKGTDGQEYAYCDYDVYGDGIITSTTGTLYNGEIDHDAKSLRRNNAFERGLQWKSGLHDFYAVYPSPVQLTTGDNEDQEVAQNIELKNGTLTGFLPNTQAPVRYLAPTEVTENNVTYKSYDIHPAMRFAYMVATANDVNPTPNGVSLTFKPIVTAVKVTLKNTGETLSNISMVSLSSGNAKIPVCGSFTTTINTSGSFTNQNSNSELLYSQVSIPVMDHNNAPITLNTNDVLSFTAFLLPNTDLQKLVLNLMVGGEVKSATLNSPNDGIIVEATKKNFITNVPVNITNQIELNYSNWMSALPTADENNSPLTLSPLSVPGAGGATSSSLSEDVSKQQTLDVANLWSRGIRCFEIQVPVTESFSSLGDETIYCNNLSTGVTLSSFMETLQMQITSYATEFAFVIITYNHNGNVDDGRNSGEFQKRLSNYVNTIGNAKKWEPTTTIEDARGKIFFISRPGSIGVDYGWHGLGTGNDKILSVLGWGFMPDQWYARGFGKLQNYFDDCYSVKQLGTKFILQEDGNGNYALDIYDKNSPNNLTLMRPFSAKSGTEAENLTYTYNKDRSNFGYYATSNTNRYGGLRTSNINNTWDGHNAWVQEWKRVVREDITVTDENKGYTYVWKESATEKWDDIVEALNMSMDDPSRKTYDYYINSLCGYYVDKTVPLSYYPSLNVQRYGEAEVSTAFSVKGPIENIIHPDGKYQQQVTYNVEGATGWFGIDFEVGEDGWGPYHGTAGYAGNIADYAKWVNDKFYNHLLSTMTTEGALNGPTGIVLMDRVSNTADAPAGYYLPQIIIAQNFVNMPTTYRLKASELEEGDTYSTRKKIRVNDSEIDFIWE